MALVQKFDVIANARAGTVLQEGIEKVRQDLTSILGDQAGDIRFVEPEDINASVKAWTDSHQPDSDTSLIIGGGDGTLLSAVSQTLRQGRTLGVLPLGTQNFLARELGFSADYKEAASQYRNLGDTPRPMTIGEVNGHHFLYGIMIDKGTLALFEAREAHRGGKYMLALRRAFTSVAGGLFGRKMSLWVDAGDGKPPVEVRGRTIAVTINSLAPRPSKLADLQDGGLKKLFGSMFAKDTDAPPHLACYAFRGGIPGWVSVIPKLFKGTWSDHRDLAVVTGSRLTLRPQAEEGETRIVLDGEIEKVRYPLDVKIIPAAVNLYQPG